MSPSSSSPDQQNGSSPRTLQKMLEAASSNNRHGCTWSHILQYLKANSVIDHSNTGERTFRFDTPIATYYIPSPSLARELASPLILKTALAGAAPQRILAALCQLDPVRVQQPDHAGRLPIHLLCRYPPTDAVHAALQILIPAYPESLVTGDSAGGRTPLHYMLQYHAEKRTVETLQLFLQKHWWPTTGNSSRNSQQRNPCLVPDTVYGALPLHYAAAHRASTAVMHALVHAAPATRHAVDTTYGRTALHWYVGRALPTTATGEKPITPRKTKADPKDSTPSSNIPSVATIQQLKSSRAVRTVDSNGRTCLHDACAAAATATDCTADWGGVVAALLDIHIGLLVAQDTLQQQTPLLVLLDTAAAAQQAVWEEQQQSSSSETTTQLEPFRVPWLHLLLKSNGEKALQLEDASGRLPLHAAVACGLDTFTESMIAAYPPALLHVDERLRVPLHCALAEPWRAALQTPASLRALLLAHTAMEHVDGRLAMKMEDGDGSTPLQYACTHAASVECVQVLLDYYPQAAYVPNPAGDLPLHCAVWSEVRNVAGQFRSSTVDSPEDEGGTFAGNVTTNDELIHLIQCLVQPLLVTPSTTLSVADSRFGMTPLHILVLFRAASYDFLLNILDLYPPAAAMYSTAPFCDSSPSRCSPLDLHDLYGDRESDEFQAIRELLYSFHPTTASHRHRQELLDACVQIIVQDVSGDGSVHHERNRGKQRGDDAEVDDDALCISHTVSNMERAYRRVPKLGRQAVLSTAAGAQSSQPHRRRHRHHRRRHRSSTQTSRRAPEVSYSTSGGIRSSSVYDDDDTGMDGYSMSGSSGSSLDSDDEEGYTTHYTTGGGTDEVDDGDDDSVYSSSFGSRSEEDYSTAGDQSRSMYTTSRGAPTTTFEEDATRSLLSEQTSYDAQKSLSTRRVGEEKKDDGIGPVSHNGGPGPATSRTKVVRPSFFSEVSMRLWTFFVLHRDADNPNDNYVKQLSEIIDSIDYPTLELLVTHPVPQYAKDYLPKDQPTQGLSFGDLASPKCRELIHKTCFFLGRYDFRDKNANALVHKGWKDVSVLLEWTEWIFTTEEQQSDYSAPGMAEKSIWATGAVPAEVGLTFRKRERPVWILFTKNRAEYEMELDVRRQLGIPVETVSGPSVGENDTCIVPILNHYNALDSERKEDRTYNAHIRDPRFRSVVVGRCEVQLADYPYALVFEKPKQGTVAETIRRCGVPSTLDRTQIAFDVATAVNHLHSKGLFNCDISLRNVAVCDADGGCFSLIRTSLVAHENDSFLGSVDENGLARFRVDTLPPEMFASLSPSELKLYFSYWKTIRRDYDIQVDDRILRPIIDFETGEVRVVKSHFVPQTKRDDIDVVPPYELQRPGRGSDLWAFGQLLYTILTGREILKQNDHMGYIEEFGGAYRHARAAVYEYIDDPLAKDILLACLGPSTTRKEFTIEKVLGHPFFTGNDKRSDVAAKVSERRMNETAAHSRIMHQKLKDLHGKKLQENSTAKIQCWDISLLERFCFSPTQIFMNSSSAESKSDLLFPYSLVVLPHEDNETSPVSLKSAQQIGLRLLELSKACFFTSVMEQATSGETSKRHVWPTPETMRVLDFSSDDFSDIQAALGEFASAHVEVFRDSPASIAAMVVEKRIRNLLKCYEDRTVFVYQVDELTNELLSDSPITVPTAWRDRILRCCLPSMMLTSLYARGWGKHVSGLTQLLLPPGFRQIPDSWNTVVRGLNHDLDDGAFLNELAVLKNASDKVFAEADTSFLSTISDFWERFDPANKRLVGLRRVEANGGAVLWTKHLDILEVDRTTMSATMKKYRRLAKSES